MSDLYHRDTTAALARFTECLDDLTPVIQSGYIDLFEELSNEVDGLLSVYIDKSDELEEAKQRISELENK